MEDENNEKDFAVIISIISMLLGIKNNRDNKMQENNYRENLLRLEEQKQALFMQRKITDQLISRLNNRANILPFFHLVLDDNKIEVIADEKKVKLTIGLINIGKESAANIIHVPIEKGSEKYYFVTKNEQPNLYHLYDYFSKYYALPGDLVEFSLVRKIPLEDNGLINDFIKFKIGFKDLLGNLYEQEFEFGYDNCFVKGYNLKNSTSIPLLIKESGSK